MGVPGALSGLAARYRYQVFIALAFITAELLVWPAGEFPLNDDWSYTKSAIHLFTKGNIMIGDWAAMTLWTHLVFALPFLKIFGFSFFILRFYVMVASLATVLLVFSLARRYSNSNAAGLLASVTLLFNPIYFNLSNTFMTDVTFLALMMAGLFAAGGFYREPGMVRLVAVAAISVLLVLTRQYGVALPAAFFAGSFFMRTGRKAFWVAGSAVVVAVTYASLAYYESYLKHTISETAAYRFSGARSVETIAADIAGNWKHRYRLIFHHVLVYTGPLALAYLLQTRRENRKAVLTLFVLFAALCGWFFRETSFPLGNVFMNMQTGVESFPETLSYNINSHTVSSSFQVIMDVFKYLLPPLTLTILVWTWIRSRKIIPDASQAMLLTFMGCYLILLLASDSYLDRYHLPLIVPALLLVSMAGQLTLSGLMVPAAIIIVYAYSSVGGTRDYFELARKKWDAYHYLTANGVWFRQINAGFEPRCWDEGAETWWNDFNDVNNPLYVIQYNCPAGYRKHRAFPFERCFPPGKDTIFIFRRIK